MIPKWRKVFFCQNGKSNIVPTKEERLLTFPLHSIIENKKRIIISVCLQGMVEIKIRATENES